MRRYGVLFCLTLLLAGCSNGDDEERDYRGHSLRVWLQMATSGTDDSKALAIANLKDFGPTEKEFVPDLKKLLKDPNRDVRIAAARLLGQIGPDAKDALNDLDELALDEDKQVFQESLKAKKKIINRKP
jgi:HEAT repeat protein